MQFENLPKPLATFIKTTLKNLTRITPAYAGTTKTVIKPVPADNVNYLSGGATRPSSPDGDGGRLFPSSERINNESIIAQKRGKINEIVL